MKERYIVIQMMHIQRCIDKIDCLVEQLFVVKVLLYPIDQLFVVNILFHNNCY